MAYYDLISENEKSTVVAEFEKGIFAAEAPYMSERNLEDQFVKKCQGDWYLTHAHSGPFVLLADGER